MSRLALNDMPLAVVTFPPSFQGLEYRRGHPLRKRLRRLVRAVLSRFHAHICHNARPRLGKGLRDAYSSGSGVGDGEPDKGASNAPGLVIRAIALEISIMALPSNIGQSTYRRVPASIAGSPRFIAHRPLHGHRQPPVGVRFFGRGRNVGQGHRQHPALCNPLGRVSSTGRRIRKSIMLMIGTPSNPGRGCKRHESQSPRYSRPPCRTA